MCCARRGHRPRTSEPPPSVLPRTSGPSQRMRRGPIANMRRALKPGGWLAHMFPNRWSLKGMVARLTPHSFHVLGYRVLFGKASATPYETRFEWPVSTRGIWQFAEREGLRVVTLEPHPGDWDWLLRKHAPVLGRLLLLAERVVQALTLGRANPNRREFIAILADAQFEGVSPTPHGHSSTGSTWSASSTPNRKSDAMTGSCGPSDECRATGWRT
jgi:hypothetical protein